MEKNDFKLKPIEESDLQTIFNWRNSDRVRFNMFESELIPWENHLKWFASLKNNDNSKCVMFQYKNESIGVITAKVVDPKIKKWIWGCYLGDGNYFKGAGTLMGLFALEYCFEKLNVDLLIGEAVAKNEVSLRFNARIGFKTEKKFIQTTSTGKQVPAILLTLTKNEWIDLKSDFFQMYLK